MPVFGPMNLQEPVCSCTIETSVTPCTNEGAAFRSLFALARLKQLMGTFGLAAGSHANRSDLVQLNLDVTPLTPWFLSKARPVSRARNASTGLSMTLLMRQGMSSLRASTQSTPPPRPVAQIPSGHPIVLE